MRLWRTLWLGVLLALLLTACGGGGGGGPEGGKSSAGGGAGGPISTVTSTIDAQSGGSLSVPEASLTIPPGALESDAALTLSVVDAPARAPVNTGLVRQARAVELRGDNARFRAPVTLQLPEPAPGQTANLVVLTEANGVSHVLAIDPQAGRTGIQARKTWQVPVGDYLVGGGATLALYLFLPEPIPFQFYRDNAAAWEQPRAGDRYAVFVHGINSSAAALRPLEEALQKTGRYRGTARFEYDYTRGPQEPAEELYRQLHSSQSPIFQTAGVQVDLYGHSFGGIVARWFLQNKGGTQVCSRLYTIGTPHEGSPAASAEWLMSLGSNLLTTVSGHGALWTPSSPTIAWLTPGSAQLTGLNNSFQNVAPALEVYTTVGDRFPALARFPDVVDLFLAGAAGVLFPQDVRSDGVVAEGSASPAFLLTARDFDRMTASENHLGLTKFEPVNQRLQTWSAGFRGRILFNHKYSETDWDVYTAWYDPAGGEEQPVLTSPSLEFGGGGFQGGISPDYRYCVVRSNQDGNSDLYRVDSRGLYRDSEAPGISDGRFLRNLTNDGYLNYYPSFSPDGTRVVYLSVRENDALYLCEANADGSGTRTVHRLLLPASTRLNADLYVRAFLEATYSPDGQTILFNDWYSASQGDPDDLDLFLIHRDGSNRRTVYGATSMQAYPAFAGSANQVVFSQPVSQGGNQVEQLDRSTGGVTRLTATGQNWAPDYYRWWRASEADWHPGFLAFVSDRAGEDTVYRMDLDGNNQTRVVFMEGVNRRRR